MAIAEGFDSGAVGSDAQTTSPVTNADLGRSDDRAEQIEKDEGLILYSI